MLNGKLTGALSQLSKEKTDRAEMIEVQQQHKQIIERLTIDLQNIKENLSEEQDDHEQIKLVACLHF